MKVRRRPYSVVLFDEIEKAHPDLFNILLQVLDDGFLTDSLGRKVDFRNTVLIMTSNIGGRLIEKGGALGFKREDVKDRDERMKQDVLGELKKTFNPEFLNRVDDIVVFHPLSEDHLSLIIDNLIEDLNRRLMEKDVQLEISDEMKKWLIKEGYQPAYGARPMRRAIQKNIEDPLSEDILKGRFKDIRKIRAIIRDDVPVFVEEETLAKV